MPATAAPRPPRDDRAGDVGRRDAARGQGDARASRTDAAGGRGGPQDRTPGPIDRLVAAARRQPVRRLREPRWVAGVAAGVAARLRIDPVIVRVAIVCLTLFFGAGLSLYLLAWVLLPDTDERLVLQDARDRSPGAIALVVTAAVVTLVSAAPHGSSPGALVPMLAVAALAWYLLWHDGGRRAPRRTAAVEDRGPEGAA